MELLEKIGLTITEAFNKLLEALPKSPITYLEANSEIKKFLSYANYFIPINAMISIAEVWLLAIAAFYVYQLILRWIKMIE